MFVKMKKDKKQNKIEEITQICSDLAQTLDYELVEAAFEKEPTGVYLRIYIDTPQGINLNDCERYHGAVQPRLERFDYDFLEVCSPGIDRPIKTQREAQKAIGQRVEVKLYKPLNGQKTIIGTFLALDDEGYHVLCGEQEWVLPSKDVAIARCSPDMDLLDENSIVGGNIE